MPELLVDFITSLDGYGGAEGWPGWWGLEGPEYLGWLGEQPNYTLLMGANTYREMLGFTSQSGTPESELRSEEEDSVDALAGPSVAKVVFSSTLQAPLAWANTRLISGDAVEAVRAMKQESDTPM